MQVTFAKGSLLKKIGEKAFFHTSLGTVTIPANVTSVGDSAFGLCIKMKKAVVGDKVATIGMYAFEECEKLESVIIGKKVKTIGENCFAEDGKLKKIVIKSTVLKTVKAEAFARTAKKAAVTVPKGKDGKYKKLLLKAGLSTKATVK